MEKFYPTDEFGSPYIKERFAAETLKDGSSFLEYAVPYFWGTMGFTYDPEYFTEEKYPLWSWEVLWNNDSYFKNNFL